MKQAPVNNSEDTQKSNLIAFNMAKWENFFERQKKHFCIFYSQNYEDYGFLSDIKNMYKNHPLFL